MYIPVYVPRQRPSSSMWPRLDNCVYFGDFGGVRWVLLVQKRPKGHGSRHDVEHAGMREGKAHSPHTTGMQLAEYYHVLDVHV
jgi:hypothetical protein